jgi:hypothetical protein
LASPNRYQAVQHQNRKRKITFLEITGFPASGSADSSIKFELDIAEEYEQAVMAVLGWESLAAEADGELPLMTEQVQQIAEAINEQLPTELDLFIGVRQNDSRGSARYQPLLDASVQLGSNPSIQRRAGASSRRRKI